MLAVEESVTSIDLRANLSATVSANVKANLDQCWQDLRTIAAPLPAPEKSTVERIADKVRGSDQKDRLFGEAVGNAAASLGFADSSVLSAGFTATTGDTWHQFLSRLRGEVVHAGGLDIMTGGYDIHEVVRIADHLLDLLLRIIARRLGSRAKYASAVSPRGVLRPIDWVDPSTKCAQLIPR